MPKLIVKQDLPEPSFQEKLAEHLRTILPVLLVLLVVVAAGAFYFSNRAPEFAQSLPAVDVALPATYTEQENALVKLSREFKTVSTRAESLEKHGTLITDAESILQHLDVMDEIVAQLKIDEDEQQALFTRHQYQKDYWESKLVFHRLRLSRFERESVVQAIVQDSDEQAPTEVAEQSGVPAEPPEELKRAAAEGLPEGVELPPGFCPLFGPEAESCKPGDEPLE